VTWAGLRAWRCTTLLRRVARHAAEGEGFRCGDLSIAVVHSARMAALHATHLGQREPTDVLTFDLGTDIAAGRLDGEVVVCADVAAAAAAARGAPTRAGAHAELALYVVHGVLHLAGYDDQTPAAFRRMHRREDELLAALGLGPVFSAAPSPTVARRLRRQAPVGPGRCGLRGAPGVRGFPLEQRPVL